MEAEKQERASEKYNNQMIFWHHDLGMIEKLCLFEITAKVKSKAQHVKATSKQFEGQHVLIIRNSD